MSAEGAETAGGPGHEASGAGGGEPTEEELRAAYEAELSRLTTTDMLAQTAVSLLNLGARRLSPPSDDPSRASERDLEQARDAIDAVRALLSILERRIPQELQPLRDALSRLQMAYARELGGAPGPATPAATTSEQPAGAAATPAEGPPAADTTPGAEEQPSGPGPAESSGRLWVPGR
jgi:hypothetical protein